MTFASEKAADLTPPVAKVVATTETLHGELRSDDYAYFRDRENPEVDAYLNAENAYTAAMTAHTEALQKTIYDELLGRIKEDDSQPPAKHDNWFYYTRTETGHPYPFYCRKYGSPSAPEQIYFDQNTAAKPFAFYQLGALEVSPDHNYLALLVDTNGYEEFELQLIDLRTGERLVDRLTNLGFGLAWASDNRTLFYLTTDSAKRADRVWRHRLGDAVDADASVYHDTNVLFNVSVERAESGDWIMITSGSFTSGETWVVNAALPESAPQLIAPRRPHIEYEVTAGVDWFYILTNDGAQNFKVMRAPMANPGPEFWEEWLAHRADAFVEDVSAFKRFIVVQERAGGLRRLRVTDIGTNETHYIDFPEAAYGVDLTGNLEFDTHMLRFTYSSLVTPFSVFDYDMQSRLRTLIKKTEVLGGYDETQYAIERVYATARDGVQVPISLVYKKPLVRDGHRPLLLYAYGSYGYTMEPTFSSPWFSLIDRGFVVAIAHVRGGQEMGRQWYDDGKMMNKKNTFFDFIDAAEFLVQKQYTSPEQLAANGGSAGGLLMGAILNMRPDLFHTVVADVPFVDVINTMLDASIPLTAQEWEQWGNPQNAGEYAYMKTYSPYDNVERKAYPRILITSGVNDSRVAYWEPTKWTAKLRAYKTDSNTLLLKMNMGAGHGGSTGRYERLKEQAFRYAFIVDQTAPVTSAS